MCRELYICKECLQIHKDMLEARGKKYAKLFHKYTKLWAGYFDNQVDEYIAYIENNPQMFVEMKKDTQSDKFEQDNIDQLMEVYTLGMVIQEGEVQQTLSIGLSMDIRNEDAITYTKTRVGELIKGVDNTTKAEIQTIIESAFTEGLSLKEVRNKILEKFKQYSVYRAELIAVMETGNAYEQGKKAQFKRYTDHFGVIGYKRSFSQEDSRTRPTHLENARAGWIPASNPFPGTGTDTAPHGFNCRCTVTYSLYNQDEDIPPSFI